MRSALARSEVYMLYSPARVKSPMKKAGKGFTPITWEQALIEMAEKLGAAVISSDDTMWAKTALIQDPQGARIPEPRGQIAHDP